MAKPATRAICRRELHSWFGSPTGYVFICLFVLLCAVALVVPSTFFDLNLANMDTLNGLYRLLLLFFIPAITMGIWANEKSYGTQELLFTLPATDLQILLGKFAAAVGVYTISLMFTLSLPVALLFLGVPDMGLVLTNYLGYWMLGVLLISVAMVSSQLTDNLTVSFILGALFCGIVVFFEDLLGRSFAAYGPAGMFEELGRGVIPFSSFLLFAGLTAAFLYLNLTLLSRRHWGMNEAQGAHSGVRFGTLVVSAVALGIFALNKMPRIDGTLERLHSLTDDSAAVLDALDPERPVYVQAFVSDEVPQHLVQTRRTLLDMLRQFDAMGGDALRLRVVPTERATDAADEAERNFGIRPGAIRDQDGQHYPFLGLAFQCGVEEVVIPFLDRATPVEYEITRSIRTVASAARRKVGIVKTDVDLFGGFDFQTMRQIPTWEIVRELELQYVVENISPDDEYPADLDVLLVPMASSLTQPQMDRLGDYIRGGGAAVLLDDPFPVSAPGTGPMDPKGGPQNPMMGGQPPPEQKGLIGILLREFGISWQPDQIAWQNFNPHPIFASMPPELVFVTELAGNPNAFNRNQEVTAGLQELVTVFSGHVQDAQNPDLNFIPLLETSGINSGIMRMQEAFTPNPFFGGQQLNPMRPYRQDPMEKILACRVSGKPADAENTIDLIFIADLDFVGTEFFQIRRSGIGDTNIQFDNVTFILNCIDELAGDSSFIELRSRRPQHRTLARLERSQYQYTSELLDAKTAAEQEASSANVEAQRSFDERVAAVENSTELDAQARSIRIEEIRRVEQRRLDNARERIERNKEDKILRAEARMEQKRASTERTTRILTLSLTPIPAIIVGLTVFSRRRRQRSSGGAA